MAKQGESLHFFHHMRAGHREVEEGVRIENPIEAGVEEDVR